MGELAMGKPAEALRGFSRARYTDQGIEHTKAAMTPPFSPQLAPREYIASHNGTAAPPWMEIFFSLPSAKNPTY